MELKDNLGQTLEPGDKIRYYSSTYKKWRDATLTEVAWNLEGVRYKIEVQTPVKGTHRDWYKTTVTILRSLKDVQKVT